MSSFCLFSGSFLNNSNVSLSIMQQIEFLQAQIQFKDEQIRHHNEAMDRKDATLKELYNKLLEK